ncbi:hypothetical protein ACWEO4_34820 [Streptomyces sp. NPDC004393]
MRTTAGGSPAGSPSSGEARTSAAVPADATPYETILAGLKALTGALQPSRERLVLRTRIIRQSPELRERELVKLASWAAALTTILCARPRPHGRGVRRRDRDDDVPCRLRTMDRRTVPRD